MTLEEYAKNCCEQRRLEIAKVVLPVVLMRWNDSVTDRIHAVHLTFEITDTFLKEWYARDYDKTNETTTGPR